MFLYVENFLLKYKRVLQVMVPTVVAVDTLRSCLVVAQLTQQRMKVRCRLFSVACPPRSPFNETISGQRLDLRRLTPVRWVQLLNTVRFSLQEWEEEERQEVVASVTHTMKKVMGRCHAGDGNFWPKALSARCGIDIPSALVAADAVPPAGVSFEDPLLPLLTPSESGDTIPQTAGDAEAAMQSEQLADMSDAFSAGHDSKAPVPATSARFSHQSSVIYITLDDVWSHLVQTTMHLSSAAMAQSGQSRLVQAAYEHQHRLVREALAAADTAREWCRGVLPWPQLEVQRRSALRCRMGWSGMSFPIRAGKTPALEADMSNLA